MARQGYVSEVLLLHIWNSSVYLFNYQNSKPAKTGNWPKLETCQYHPKPIWSVLVCINQHHESQKTTAVGSHLPWSAYSRPQQKHYIPIQSKSSPKSQSVFVGPRWWIYHQNQRIPTHQNKGCPRLCKGHSWAYCVWRTWSKLCASVFQYHGISNKLYARKASHPNKGMGKPKFPMLNTGQKQRLKNRGNHLLLDLSGSHPPRGDSHRYRD